MKKTVVNNSIVHILLIVVIGLFAYSNTFQSSFIFDDEPNIVNNPVVKDLRYYLNPSEAKNFQGFAEYPTLTQRYIGSLTFALNYKLHGLDVTGYHIVNLAIHIINALLVYVLVILTFHTPFLLSSRVQDYRSFAALFSALLFVSHPIQTQAVTYIVQRFASLTTLFYLLSLVTYIKARLSSTSALTLTWYVLSLISAVLAMKTKQIAFTLPLMIVLYEYLFLKGKHTGRVLLLIPLILTMLIIPYSMTGLDKPIGELIGDVDQATRIQKTIPRLEYLFTEFRVITTYLRLLFLPINQNFDYDYPVYHSFFNAEVLLSFLLLSLILTLGVYGLYRFRKTIPAVRLISFGIFWFFITLSVESSLIPLQVINEHRMYLPSTGIYIVFSIICFITVEKLKQRTKTIEKPVILTLLLIVMVLTGLTYARNRVWKDGVTLWEDVVNKSPNMVRGHYNLGLAYHSRDVFDKAAEQYELTLKLNPSHVEAHNNLGNVYTSQGLIDKAITEYEISLTLNPDYTYAHINLGNAYRSMGLTEKAIKEYQIAIKLEPENTEAYNYLGTAYKSQGLIDKAVEQYTTAIRLNPSYPDAHYNLGVEYGIQGLPDLAIEQYLIAIKLKPGFSEAHNNLGVIYGSKGLMEKAIEHFHAVTRFRPDDPDAHFNLGIAYGSRGLVNQAIEQYLIAIRLSPDFPETHYNLGNAYFSKGLSDKAAENYNKAISLKPDWEEPHYNLGLIYLKQGDTEKARKEFETVLQINPHNDEAQKLLDLITNQ